MKTRIDGKKCKCNHYEKEHSLRLKPLIADPESRNYLTNGEWWDKQHLHRGFIDEWMRGSCKKCDCK